MSCSTGPPGATLMTVKVRSLDGAGTWKVLD
jgi:hypothetical protein